MDCKDHKSISNGYLPVCLTPKNYFRTIAGLLLQLEAEVAGTFTVI